MFYFDTTLLIILAIIYILENIKISQSVANFPTVYFPCFQPQHAMNSSNLIVPSFH